MLERGRWFLLLSPARLGGFDRILGVSRLVGEAAAVVPPVAFRGSRRGEEGGARRRPDALGPPQRGVVVQG